MTPGVPAVVGPILLLGPKVNVLVSTPVVSVKVVACVPLKLLDCAFASPDKPAPTTSKTAENPRQDAP